MKMTEKILEQVEVGIIPDNKDLDIAIDFYQTTTDNLRLLGKAFHLPWKECYRQLMILKEFKEARKRK